jgi:hypothetical protein
MAKRATILLALAVFVAGCGAGLPPDVARLSYVNRPLHFAMNVPAGWTVRESTGMADVFVLGPETPGAARPNVTVVVEPGRTALTVEELTRNARQQLEALKGFKLLGESPRALADGRAAFVMTFEQSSLGPTLRERQLFVVAGGRAYIVTATASPAAFAEREADFEAVLQSFRAGW